MLRTSPGISSLGIRISFPKTMVKEIDFYGEESVNVYYDPDAEHGIWTTADGRTLGDQVPWPGGTPWPHPPCAALDMRYVCRAGVLVKLDVARPVQPPGVALPVAASLAVGRRSRKAGGAVHVALLLRLRPNPDGGAAHPRASCARVSLTLAPFAFPPETPVPPLLVPGYWSDGSSSPSYPSPRSSFSEDGLGTDDWGWDGF
jgi:hypothetical protein